MKLFLSIAAVLAWIFGAGLLLAPDKFYAPMGITMTPILATIVQAHGATLFGLGVVIWLARDADRKGLVAVITGNLVVQVLSLLVAIRIVLIGGTQAGAPAIVIHTVLGSLYAFFLAKLMRAPKGA